MHRREGDKDRRFLRDVEDLAGRVMAHIEEHRAAGKMVIGLGVSTKGNTRGLGPA